VLEIKEDQVDVVCEKMAELTQMDRGCTIPGKPVGVDLDVGEDYSFGKFEKQYPDMV
jgi:hypothetical protein